MSKMNIHIGDYTEDGYDDIPTLRLSDEEYARALQSIVVTCTDILLVSKSKKLVHLASRKAKPMAGWWLIGGKMVPGDSPVQSAVKNLIRETQLTLDEGRFQLISISNYKWKDRQQQPQNIGCHMLSYVFAVEVSDVELEYIVQHLEENEYQSGILKSFDREKLINENASQVIIDLYDFLFSTATE